MENIGRVLMLIGALVFMVGALLVLMNKLGIPIGRLPGDIYVEGENGSFYFPVTSSIAISLLLTMLLNFVFRILQK